MAGPGKYGGFDPPPDEAVPEPAPGVVDLAERNLAEFPAVTKALRAAVEINLEGNELVSVPTGALSRLTRLETQRLTGCALTHLPEDLGRCESIARLFAGANRITDASPAFELPCAVHVGLSHNRIGALPPPRSPRAPRLSCPWISRTTIRASRTTPSRRSRRCRPSERCRSRGTPWPWRRAFRAPWPTRCRSC